MSNSDPVSSIRGLQKSPVPLDMCGMAGAAKLLGDNWTLLILREVFYGVTRFDDLRNELGVSSATLSNRILRLVELGLLKKEHYRVANSRPRSEYLLTEAGRGLGPVLLAMMNWADTYLGKQPSPLDMVDRRSGNALHLALVDDHGQITDWSDVVPVVRTDLIAQA